MQNPMEPMELVTEDRIVAYPGPDGILNDWHGRPIGRWRSVCSWSVRSYVGSRMHSIRATVDRIVYRGRGFGEGMLFRGKRVPLARVMRRRLVNLTKRAMRARLAGRIQRALELEAARDREILSLGHAVYRREAEDLVLDIETGGAS